MTGELIGRSNITRPWPDNAVALLKPELATASTLAPFEQRDSRCLNQAVSDQLSVIGELPDDWDGYGAPSISDGVLRNAIDFAFDLPSDLPTPEIAPMANGTITFEWECSRGSGCMEIGRTKFSLFIKLADGNPLLMDGETKHRDRHIGMYIQAALFTSLPPSSLTTVVIALERQRHSQNRWR